MIGLLVGATAIAGLIAFKRRHHHHRRWAYMHGGCAPRGYHGHHGGWDGDEWPGHHRGHGGPGGFLRRRALHAVLARLDCTPAQERLIREEVDGLLGKLREQRDEREASREDLARALAGEQLDRGALDAMFARHDQRLVALRGEVVAALGRIHASLDDKQRARLGELVRGGLRGWRGGGPYR